ncbi:uncharacterized protein [Engystomops pustulosus]|uniref:uncharacterized protein isoform X1 n=1 Tax=Engystomops pustulosus TaxID=76066 RepID=UPI003AFA4823
MQDQETPGQDHIGDLVYDPDTLLWIRSVNETDVTTDDDSTEKEPSQRSLHLKTGTSTNHKAAKRQPIFTATEELVLVRELLKHYDKLYGERARITPFAQKVSIWQRVLENVNSVSVRRRGIEEAKKHWHFYKHRLIDKLVAMQKQTPGAGSESTLLARLTPLEGRAANLFKLEYVVRSATYPPVASNVPGSQSSKDIVPGDTKEGLRAQNGDNREKTGDCNLSKAPRNIKFSFDENCVLVHESVGVWDGIIGRNAATTSQSQKNLLWSRIAEAVNAAGSQPRSVENCKKRLRNIISGVKAKMVDQQKHSQQNGGAPCLDLQFLSYEEELMHVIGPDIVRPIEGHVDTDRGPRPSNNNARAHMGFTSYSSTGQKNDGQYDPEDFHCYDDDFWNHSSFDMAEEEDEEDKEMTIKTEPVDYNNEAPAPSAQIFPSASPPPLGATQLNIPSSNPVVASRPPIIPPKHIPGSTKSLPVLNKPVSLPGFLTTKPPSISNYPSSSSSAPSNINKVVGSLHTAQRHYHRSQSHQLHVLHMDLLHLGVGLQQLTRNVKVNNHVRAKDRVRKAKQKQKHVEDQRQYRMEKLSLLRQHHEAKLKIMQGHHERKERLMHENNLILQGILQHLSNSAGTIPAATCSTNEQSTSHVKAQNDPLPPAHGSD